MRLVNSGLPAEGVSVRVTVPQGAEYVAGSAHTSQGTVSGEGPLEFAIGAVPADGSVELRYSVRLLPDIDLPGMVRSDVTIAWSTGQVFRTITAYAGASSALYLPSAAR